MFTSLRRFALLSVAALLVGGMLTAPSYAQRVLWNSNRLINPNYQIYPGLSYRQYAYNMALLGRAYSHIPPYALGYNPYPAVVNYGPVYPYYAPPAYYYNPYLYSGYYNPYYYGSYYYGY